MALWLVLIFVGLPILEIALFIEVGGAIGLLPTLAIIVLTAVLGAALIGAGRACGRSTGCGRAWRRAATRSGRSPTAR